VKKIILDLYPDRSKEALHEYLAKRLAFPSYYGKNLDALYDCLTDIHEDTCIGLFMPDDAENEYLRRTAETFADAEEENRHLCVIMALPHRPGI